MPTTFIRSTFKALHIIMSECVMEFFGEMNRNRTKCQRMNRRYWCYTRKMATIFSVIRFEMKHNHCIFGRFLCCNDFFFIFALVVWISLENLNTSTIDQTSNYLRLVSLVFETKYAFRLNITLICEKRNAHAQILSI